MSRSAVQTGPMIEANVELALYRAYVDMSDEQLKERNVTREDVLWLARHFGGDGSGYRSAELTTIADQVLAAFRAGQVK